MSTTPETRRGKLSFYEAHLQAWADHAEPIGLSAEQIAGLESRIEAARSALLAAEVARDAARAATLTFHETADDLAGFGSGLIAAIRATAETAEDGTGDEGVYALAQIPPHRRPGPAPAPGRPSGLRTDLLGDGSLSLSWACDNPRGIGGTMYEIHRRPLGADRTPAGPDEFIGLAGARKFVDATLPAGTAGAVYRITAVRSTRRGEPAEFVVNLGVGGASSPAAAADPDAYRMAG